MPISNSYPRGIPVEDQDLFVGTKAYNNRTVNYTAQGVADYLNINSKVAIGGQMSFQFVTVPNVAKTIAFDGGGGNNTAFSAITKLIVSAVDASTANITIFLNYLNNSQVLLSEQNQPNFFGHYKITGYTQIGTSAFYELDLEFIGGNGTIFDKQYYDLVSFVLSAETTTEWGSITGDIEDQTDLINYISSQVTTPTLQQVTTAGAITTDAITVAGIYSGNLYSDGYNFGISDNYDTNYNLLYQPYTGLQITNSLESVYIYQDASIGFQNFAGGYGNLRSDFVTGSWSWQFPDASGTLALTSDIPIIPTVGTWGALNYPTWTTGTPFVKMTAAGTFALDTNTYLTTSAAALTYYPIPTGTISQYIRGDGSLATLPSTTVPTLQQVTTAGNVTTNTMIIGGGASPGDTTMFLGTSVQITVLNSTGGYSNVAWLSPTAGLLLKTNPNTGFFSSILKSDLITGADKTFQFPNNSGTLALLSDIPSLTGYVPYTGATTDLDLGTYNLTADHINLNVSPSGAGFVVGSTQWNNDLGSSQTLLKGGSVTLKNGVDLVARVVNKVVPNTTLTKAAYQVVKVSGAQGQRLAVDLAQADTDLNSADTLGVVTETITTNQEGFILTVGQLLDINTTGSLQGETWNDGDVLYLSPTVAGRMTNIKPNGSTGHIVVLGYVEYAHANNGKIYVKIMNGWELDELHNVFISTPLNNQVLSYASATDLWVNRNVSEFNDLQVRRNGFILFDDLLTIANGTSPFIKGALSSGQILALGNTQNNPGVITINCSATANSGAYVTYVNSATPTSSLLSNNMGFDAIVSIGPAPVANTTIRTGLIRGTMTSADATEGCYFEIIGTGIVGKTAMGGVRSSTASFTLVANTFYHLRVIYNSTTLNTFQVYSMSGSLLFSATLNTNISTGFSAIQPAFIATSTLGSASTIALLDYIAIEYPSYNRGALT